MIQPDPSYDPRSALLAFAPGVQLTRDNEAALVAQYETNNFQPLTADQVLAIAGPLPAPLTSIPRLRGDCA